MKHYTIAESVKFAKTYTQAQLAVVFAGRPTMTILDLMDSPYVPAEHKHVVVFSAMDRDDIAAVVPALLAKVKELHGADAAVTDGLVQDCAVVKNQNVASTDDKWVAGAAFQARRVLAAGSGPTATEAALQLANYVAVRAGWNTVFDLIKRTVGA